MKIESDSSPPNRLNSQHKTTYFRKKETMNKNKISLVLIAIFLYVTANSQINKGYWLVGGNINYSSTSYQSDFGSRSQAFDFKVAPNLGYFAANKFAVGFKSNIGKSGFKLNTDVGNPYYIDFNLGPFLRYYLLPVDKQYNLLTEIYYQYGFIGSNGKSNVSKNTFSLQGGTEVYFNSSIGLEFLIGYTTTKYVGYSGRNNQVQFGIGLQAHLIKDK